MRRRLAVAASLLAAASIVTTLVTFTRPVAYDGLWFSAVCEATFAFAIALALYVSNPNEGSNP